jgi:hypothetical protein
MEKLIILAVLGIYAVGYLLYYMYGKDERIRQD